MKNLLLFKIFFLFYFFYLKHNLLSFAGTVCLCPATHHNTSNRRENVSVSCNNRDRNIDAWSTLKGKRCSGAETPSCASGQLPALFPEREFDWNFSSSSLTRPQCLFGMSVHYYYHVTINVGRVGGADIIVIYCGDAAHRLFESRRMC